MEALRSHGMASGVRQAQPPRLTGNGLMGVLRDVNSAPDITPRQSHPGWGFKLRLGVPSRYPSRYPSRSLPPARGVGGRPPARSGPWTKQRPGPGQTSRGCRVDGAVAGAAAVTVTAGSSPAPARQQEGGKRLPPRHPVRPGLVAGSRAAADAAIYMASYGWMSEDNFEPFLLTALVERVRRLYDQIYGRGSLLARAQREKAEVRAEAEAALDRDRVTETYMEDPDDCEATNAARSRLREAPEPPSIFGYLPA